MTTIQVLCVLCVAWPLCLEAEPPKKLADVCPKLQIPRGENRPDAADEPIVIDNAMVQFFSSRYQFAAIASAAPTQDSTPAEATDLHKTRKQHRTRDQWRAEHRREVAAIRKLALRLAIAREELAGLQDQYFSTSTEAQRMRLEPRLNRKELEIEDLEYNLQKRRDSFSRLMHEARHDGAQPGWFRDLPRP